MIAGQQKSIADRPWLDPEAQPQVIIEGVSKTFGGFAAASLATRIDDAQPKVLFPADAAQRRIDVEGLGNCAF